VRSVRKLVAEGHEVTGTTRSEGKQALLRGLGATPVLADALDRDAMFAAVRAARPEVVVHQLTAIGQFNPRNLDSSFEATNRLRTEGTDILVAAARDAGARLLVAQSYAGWPYARVGGPVKAEDDPLDQDPPKGVRSTIAAIRHLERTVLEAEGLTGVVLRYGGFYGPGTGLARGGEMLESVTKGRFPVVGDGNGVWSFIHIEDAADATVAAIDRGEPGVFNIVDDDPAPVAEFLPALAEAVGARKPRHVPGFVGRLLLGPAGYTMMTRIRGASNAKAKRELGWTPRHPSWRQGFQAL
jgi:nucleoside-diphosphate-sugar epimerase